MTDTISLDDLAEHISPGSILLIEALSADFHAAGHLPGAVSVPLASSDDELRSLVERAGRPAIVVYGSRDGGEAAELAQRIAGLAGRDVQIFTGGKEAWVEAGHDLERDPEN